MIKEIEGFTPKYQYPKESYYQEELFQKIKSIYPVAEREYLSNDIKPDIVIRKVAIELKGPTYRYDLQSIYSKCFEYLTEYQALILVLFDVQATEGQYKKVVDNVTRYFPRAIIIRKEVNNLPKYLETSVLTSIETKPPIKNQPKTRISHSKQTGRGTKPKSSPRKKGVNYRRKR